MPLVNVYSSAESLPSERADALLLELSKTTARVIGKPESYVMTCLVPKTRMTFAGSTAPACYVEVKSIGQMTPALTERLSAELSAALEAGLGVPKSRTYIEFADAKGYQWGFNGGTFG